MRIFVLRLYILNFIRSQHSVISDSQILILLKIFALLHTFIFNSSSEMTTLCEI